MTDQANMPHENWYRRAFQEEYLEIYGHRDLAEAARATKMLTRELDLRPELRVLDLCCGPGRHLVFLGRVVRRPVGLDLSRVMLTRARLHWDETADLREPGGSDGAPAALIQGTMSRLPLADGCMDRVVNLFTSFGYYEQEEKNREVLAEVARVLRPGGMLALDHINRQTLLDNFEPHSDRTMADGRRITEQRIWDEGASRVVKHIHSRWPDGRFKRWHESVRVYKIEELEAILLDCGLTVTRRLGDYDGDDWRPTAPRMILLASKPA
jgi:SAM-dependent methyltransferase